MKVRLTFEWNFPNDRFSDVLQRLIATHGRLSRAEAAELAHLAPNSFSRTFHRMCGRSYRSVQLEIRMRIAACFLQQTHLDVSEIAAGLGYAEISKFHQAFRRFYGYPPATFRKRRRRKGYYFILELNGVLEAHCKVVLSQLSSDARRHRKCGHRKKQTASLLS